LATSKHSPRSAGHRKHGTSRNQDPAFHPVTEFLAIKVGDKQISEGLDNRLQVSKYPCQNVKRKFVQRIGGTTDIR